MGKGLKEKMLEYENEIRNRTKPSVTTVKKSGNIFNLLIGFIVLISICVGLYFVYESCVIEINHDEYAVIQKYSGVIITVRGPAHIFKPYCRNCSIWPIYGNIIFDNEEGVDIRLNDGALMKVDLSLRIELPSSDEERELLFYRYGSYKKMEQCIRPMVRNEFRVGASHMSLLDMLDVDRRVAFYETAFDKFSMESKKAFPGMKMVNSMALTINNEVNNNL